MDKKDGATIYTIVVIFCVLLIVIVGIVTVESRLGDCTEWEGQFTKEYAEDQCYKENYTNCEIRYNGDQMIIDFAKFERYNETYECTKWEGGTREYQWASIFIDPRNSGLYCEYAEDKDACCQIKNGEVGYWDEKWGGCVKRGN